MHTQGTPTDSALPGAVHSCPLLTRRSARSVRGSDRVEELSYLHRPSLRAGHPRLCWSRSACGSALAVRGLPVPGGVTPTGHACGGGCARHCARLQLMKANIREFEPSDEEPVVGLSPRAWNRCSPPWRDAGNGVVRPAAGVTGGTVRPR